MARLIGLTGLVCVASAGACGSDPEPAASVAVADAGPPCERGSENCACIGGGGCRDDLLCISGRCLLTDRDEQPDPTGLPPSRPRPPAPVEPGEPDAGQPPNAPADAGATPPDASTAELDAGGEPSDASSSSD
jgi:hypothetical protein